MIHSDTQCKFCPPGKETKLTGSTSLEDCQSGKVPNSLPKDKILDWSIFKAFADNIIQVNEKIEILFGKGRKH